MARMLKVRPTKIELVKLQRRLALSRRVHKILKDRLAILTTEFIATARRAITARERMAGAVRRATTAAGVAEGFHGRLQLELALADSQGGATVTAGTRNLAGTRVPQLQLVLPERRLPPYDLVLSSSMVDDAADAGREALAAIIVLAELDRTLELLGMEIQRTKRISNALEYVVVPALERTIRALSMKFEERDREEKARLKHIKVLRSHATAASY